MLAVIILLEDWYDAVLQFLQQNFGAIVTLIYLSTVVFCVAAYRHLCNVNAMNDKLIKNLNDFIQRLQVKK